MRVSYVLLAIAAALVANCQVTSRGFCASTALVLTTKRVFDIKKLFDVKILLGLGKAVKNVEDDFAMQTIANMLTSKATKKKMFKKWDKGYTLEGVKKQLQEYLKHKPVADLFADYSKRRVLLK
ncbi:hypothetical protein PF005_g25655 [Phytophthora fragariae]|uniref:RxLR effector protein n=1 Tax=Phytophthora fragariae TaxID=53985 RepID=A0A6A4BUV0_9STRA|nr:hypothetical protein PF003_g25129 [Phytophthora fragariae]KAE8945885.1 hypothetical protein PF009_g4477 [Phytophthora fragariae]KAE8975465.1 hypothetical protein PF011_g24457 [Phytophthora fragariae]KAE9073143.1 hypothetical protein PF010_g25198 [Phytophthora fragariae]KAE9073419.1 hypothetical protein PF007_g25809 [Phytophthora fragariae]